MELHELAAKDLTIELKKALSLNKSLIDLYELSKDFHKVINRHGLKGTPLHFAIIHNSISSVNALLDCGADITKCVRQCERGEQDISHADALFLAEEIGNKEICDLLKAVS